MSAHRYWVSFDLVLGANYDELYKWLADRDAKECGDSLATFVSQSDKQQLIDDLKKLAAKLDARARLYLISTDGGTFVHGGRRQAPWAGYGAGTAEVDEA